MSYLQNIYNFCKTYYTWYLERGSKAGGSGNGQSIDIVAKNILYNISWGVGCKILFCERARWPTVFILIYPFKKEAIIPSYFLMSKQLALHNKSNIIYSYLGIYISKYISVIEIDHTQGCLMLKNLSTKGYSIMNNLSITWLTKTL